MNNSNDDNFHRQSGPHDLTVFHLTIPDQLSAEEEERILSLGGRDGDRLREQYNRIFPGRFPARPPGEAADDTQDEIDDDDSDAASIDSNLHRYATLTRVTDQDRAEHAEMLKTIVDKLTENGDTISEQQEADISRLSALAFHHKMCADSDDNAWTDLTSVSFYFLLAETYTAHAEDYTGLRPGPALKDALISACFEPVDAGEVTQPREMSDRVLAFYS